jgi:hypothetical protein
MLVKNTANERYLLFDIFFIIVGGKIKYLSYIGPIAELERANDEYFNLGLNNILYHYLMC